MTNRLELVSDYQPAGDQPQAIEKLCAGLNKGKREQVLLGVTGSGKTFTMAQIISRLQRPAMVMAHNKTLAAQLYHEFKHFFPNNAVEYFVSYYDYYQPEAYVARTDTYIEKDSNINEQIERLRHSATRAMLERRDVIVVASVSCIYGIGSAETYQKMTLELKAGESYDQRAIIKKLIEIQYKRNDTDFKRGTFRVRGDTLDIFPAHMADRAWRLSFFGDELESIAQFDPLTGERDADLPAIAVFANSHYVTPRVTLERAIGTIKEELKQQLNWFNEHHKLLEAQRLEQRTQYDIEMLMETGSCKGIENYTRHLNGAPPGAPPPTLFSYLPDDAILFVDESHVMVPQIGAMANGDYSRKSVLADHGFRLPSCIDNRPLKFEEWDSRRPQTVFVSATPAAFEVNRAMAASGAMPPTNLPPQAGGGKEGGASGALHYGQTPGIVEQIIRPTGLTDPPYEIRPIAIQVDDLLAESRETIAKGYRVMVTTLTKRMAEELTDYMTETGLRVAYLHSDVDTLERVEIIRDLRLGKYDVLVGVNLLREGLDIPECGLMAILDADKEGFLRSQTSLIQTIGRAARNVDSKVILYADRMTDSMKAALEETDRRRAIQQAYNEKHGITPQSVKSRIGDSMQAVEDGDFTAPSIKDKTGRDDLAGKSREDVLVILRQRMLEAAANLEFEQAAHIRDEITRVEERGLTGQEKDRARSKKSAGKR